MGDPNLALGGIASILTSGLNGYAEGQQIVNQRMMARLNAMRQGQLAQIQQQRANAEDDRNANLAAFQTGTLANRNQNTNDRYGNEGQTQWLKAAINVAGQPIGVQRNTLAPIKQQYGLTNALPGDPLIDPNGQPVMGDDGQPKTVDPIGYNPQQASLLNKAGTYRSRAMSGDWDKLQKEIAGGVSAPQAQSDFDAFNQIYGTNMQPPMRQRDYGRPLNSPESAQLRSVLADPSQHGTYKDRYGALDLDTSRSLGPQTIDNSPSALNAAKMALDQSIGAKNDAYTTQVIPTIAGRNTAETNFLAGPKTDLAKAQANDANANADYRKVMTQWVPQNIASEIDNRKGILDLNRWRAEHGAPMTMKDVLDLQARLSKPGPSSTLIDPNSGQMSITPGKTGLETNPALAQQLEGLKAQLSTRPPLPPLPGRGPNANAPAAGYGPLPPFGGGRSVRPIPGYQKTSGGNRYKIL